MAVTIQAVAVTAAVDAAERFTNVTLMEAPMPMSSLTSTIFDRMACATLFTCMFVLLAGAPVNAKPAQASYGSLQEAVDALAKSVRSGEIREILTVLGPDGRNIVSSGDAVADALARDRFVTSFAESHEIRQIGDGPYILYVGKDDYPFPLPLVSSEGKWRFDTAAGAEEILDRRIGENELAAIEVLKAFVDAQREYAEADRDGKGPQYARRILSSRGKTDGLYWPTNEGDLESPIGPLVAEARSEGYKAGKAGRTPYHGYLFRILTAQGKDAVGSSRNYIVGGRMIGGFALVASPAQYGNSGIKTFIVNQDGVVFEKDLGEKTRRLVDRMDTFNPGEGWERVLTP